MKHTSVLKQETIDLLNVRPDGIYVDGTLGRGGHASLLASKLENGHLYAFDQDEQAIEESRENLKEYADHITFIHANFRSMKECLNELGVNKVDGIMMDLGVSSPQFDDPERGFSYRFNARLDMRMDQTRRKDAEMVVNTYSEKHLADVIREYGEERYARSIAAGIVKARQVHPVHTTFELDEIIRESVPKKYLHEKGHPAKRTFQAIRIEVNDEMSSLQKGLEEALGLLNVKGRCAVITFQSLEDRIVKQTFRRAASVAEPEAKLPIKENEIPKAEWRLITKKPILPGEEEIAENHRAHSAKLRCIERTGNGYGENRKTQEKAEDRT